MCQSRTSITPLVASPNKSVSRGAAAVATRCWLRAVLVCLVCPALLSGAAAAAVAPAAAAASLVSRSTNQGRFATSLSETISSDDRHGSPTTVSNSLEAGQQTKPGPRWGHTAAYLPSAQSIIFIGGQVPSNGSQRAGMVTNDVLALDVSHLILADATLATQTASPNKDGDRWTRLSSAGLPPHAFAARALTHKANQEDAQIWLVGGATDDCSDNAPIYRWSASAPGLSNGTWDAISNLSDGATVPVRRRGARAIQVPNELGARSMQDAKKARQTGATTFMVVGGTTDGSTCAPSSASSKVGAGAGGAAAPAPAPADYLGVDLWASLPTSSAKAVMSTRSLALDARMAGFPLVDYATVLLPANSTTKSNARVLFLGGRGSDQSLVDMSRPWALDLATGRWERWITSPSIDAHDMPAGRVGHTASRAPDGKIIVHGGFLSTAAPGVHRNATHDLFVLDPTVTPARWSRISNFDGETPARAFHTAIWAGNVLVVGFGQEAEGVSAVDEAVSARAELDVRAQSRFASLQYLDTAAPGGWAWSASIADVLAKRKGAARAPVADGPLSTASIEDSQSQKGANGLVTPHSSTLPGVGTQHIISNIGNEGANSKALQTPNELTPVQPSQKLTKPEKTGVIAGSVLGAAALVAAFAGVYAARARKRRRLEEEKDALQSYYARDAASPVDTLADRGPPVSSLWINQPKTWANTASRGLKRHASNASNAIFNRGRREGQADARDEEKNTYTSPAQGAGATSAFKIKRKAPPRVRTSMRRQQEAVRAVLGDPPHASSFEASRAGLPESFIEALVADDHDAYISTSIQNTVQSTRPAPEDVAGQAAGDDGGQAFLDFPDVGQPLQHMMTRAPSSESLGSVGTASHFSYPYLAAMHRPSMATMQSPGQATIDLGNSPGQARTSPGLRVLELPNAMRQHRIRKHQAQHVAAALREYGKRPPPTPIRVSSRQETPAWWKEMMTSPERRGMLWSPTLLSPRASLRRGRREGSDEGTEEMLVNAAEMDGTTSPTITDFAMDVAAREDGRRRRSMSSPLFPWEENVHVGGTTLRPPSPVPFYDLPTRPPSAHLRNELSNYQQDAGVLGADAEAEASLDAQRRRSQHASRRKARKSTLRVINAVVRPSSSEECAENTPKLV